MNTLLIIGIVLIILGTIALSIHGISYTTRERIFQIGPIEATHEERRSIPVSPLLSAVVLCTGIVLALFGMKG